MKDNVSSNIDSLRKENERLMRAVEELSILNEISTAVASTMELNKIEELMVRKCIKHFNVEQTAVMLLKEEVTENPFQTMIREVNHSGFQTPYRLDAQLTGWMLKNRKSLLVNDLKTDKRFQIIPRDGVQIKSLLCVPLFLKGKMIGLIACFNKKNDEGFTEDDQRLLSIIGAQSAQVIENARLYKQEQMLTCIQEEHRLAADIQHQLLPKAAPQLEGYDIAGVSYPAQIVGGDYFDFISIDRHRLAFCLGDISGKGIPAALLMANLQATVRAETARDAHPAQSIKRINHLLYCNTASNKFATMFYGVLDSDQHVIRYTNAGHNRPVLISGEGGVSMQETAGVCLSILKQYDYPEDTVTLQAGDVFILYSDGITEAMNSKDEEYGEKKLIEIAGPHREQSAHELISTIIKDVQKYAGTRPQFDDITLVVIKKI